MSPTRMRAGLFWRVIVIEAIIVRSALNRQPANAKNNGPLAKPPPTPLLIDICSANAISELERGRNGSRRRCGRAWCATGVKAGVSAAG